MDDTLLRPVILGLVQGTSRALAERVLRGRQTSVDLHLLVREVAELRETQEAMQISLGDVTEALRLLERMISGLPAFQLVPPHRLNAAESRDVLASNLLHLDYEVARLRIARESVREVPAGGSRRPRIDVLSGLDEEIAALREE